MEEQESFDSAQDKQQNEVQEEQNVQIEPAPLSTTFSHSKLIISIIAVFVLVIAGIAGAYFFFQPKAQPVDDTETATSAETAERESTVNNVENTDTSAWKTYTNTKYGYEIQYPSHWTVLGTDLQGATETITNDADGISLRAVEKNNNSLDIIVWRIPPNGGIEPISIPNSATGRDIKISGINTTLYSQTESDDCLNRYAKIQNQGVVYYFIARCDSKNYSDSISELLSTFKLANQKKYPPPPYALEFDPKEWEIIETKKSDIDGDGQIETIHVMKSVLQDTECKFCGDFNSHYLRLRVLKNDVAIHDSITESTLYKNKIRYFNGVKDFIVNDITGDGISEIVFSSYAYGPTGGTDIFHILHFDGKINVFVDITSDSFSQGRNHGFQLVKFADNDKLVPITATLVKYICGSCGGYPYYNIYEWNDDKFVLSKTIEGERRFESIYGEPQATEVDYISEKLTTGSYIEWMVHRDTNYGYEFRYPKTFNVDVESNKLVITDNSSKDNDSEIPFIEINVLDETISSDYDIWFREAGYVDFNNEDISISDDRYKIFLEKEVYSISAHIYSDPSSYKYFIMLNHRNEEILIQYNNIETLFNKIIYSLNFF